MAAAIARELGGGRRAITLAALAVATTPLYLATGSLFQTVVFDQVWWALVLLVVIRLLKGADPRWWVAVGALVGAGLQTKWTMALLGTGLAVGLASVSRTRAHLRLYALDAAAGAVATEGWLATAPRRWRRAVGALVANGLVPLAALVPIAAVETYADLFHDLNDEPAGTFVTVRYPPGALAPYCDSLGPVAVVQTIDGVDNQMADTPVMVCRHLRVTPDELREALRHYE